MTDEAFGVTRRNVLAGFATGISSLILQRRAIAQTRPKLMLRATHGGLSLRAGQPVTPLWSLAPADDATMRFKRGDEIEVTLNNELPVPVLLNWHGIDGALAAEPLTGRPPLASGGSDTFIVTLRHAGTFWCDLRLLGDGQASPSRGLALMAGESENVGVDRDSVFLIEDWRLRPDGVAVSPGSDARGTQPIYTVNGQTSLDIAARTNERLRIRFINGFQRNVIALKLDDHDVQVMAIDGQPAEPFLARIGQLVLAPGTRIDAFVDALRPPGSASTILLHDGAEPHAIGRIVYSNEASIRNAPLSTAAALPSNGLPSRLDLRNALRIDLAFGGSQPDWVAPREFAKASAPAFNARRGRTVVLALTNRAEIPTVFHLHGHHFRLLDRLDDGWKPFWLDTLTVDAGQTQRVAFAAEHAGRWLMEAMASDWAAPRLVRWYSVD